MPSHNTLFLALATKRIRQINRLLCVIDAVYNFLVQATDYVVAEPLTKPIYFLCKADPSDVHLIQRRFELDLLFKYSG